MKIDLDDKVVRFLVQEYVNKICHYSSEDELDYNVHKLIHTFQVVEMAQKLIDNTKPALPQKLKKQILNAAVLHDIGRCHEFGNGEKVNIDHGQVGADLIKQNFPTMKIETLSTLFHNKLPSDKDPKSCQPVLDYVRDADMLANLKYEIKNTNIWLKHICKKANKTCLTPQIDKEIFEAIQENRPAFTNKIKNKNLLTLWLWQICWYYNLRTKAGIRYAQKEKLFIRFRDLIFQKIVPLTTDDKKLQCELIKKIQELFPDKKFK